MQLILTRNLSNGFTQPAADYMKIVFAHNPHFHINKVESASVEEGPFFSKKEKIIVDYAVLPGSTQDIDAFIRSAIAMRGDLQLISLESHGVPCKFSPQY